MNLQYDPTGVDPTNHVPIEVHTLTESVAIWPNEGPFYIESLQVKGIDVLTGLSIPLHFMEDYTVSPLFITATLATHKDVYSYLLITTPAQWGNITLNYQATGGLPDTVLQTEIDQSSYDPLLNDDYLSFVGEASTYATAGVTLPITSQGWIELLNGGLNDVIAQLQLSSISSIEQQIYNNTDDNRAQDLLIAQLTAKATAQQVLLQSIEDIINQLLAYRARLSVINDEQDQAIADNSEAIVELTTLGGATSTETSALEALIAANTLKNIQQDTLLPINASTIVPQNNTLSHMEDLVIMLQEVVDATLSVAELLILNTANSAPLATTDASVDTIASRNVAQDLLIDDYGSRITALQNAQANNQTLNIASLQVGNATNAATLLQITPRVNDNAEIDPLQDTAIALIAARILALQNGSTEIDVSSVQAIMDATEVLIDKLVTDTQANVASNTNQDTLLAQVEAQRNTILESSGDLGSVDIALTLNEGLIETINNDIVTLTAKQIEQNSSISLTAAKVTNFTVTGVVDTTDLTTIIQQNNVTLLDNRVTVDEITNVNTTQEGRITALLASNQLQDNEISDITARINSAGQQQSPPIETPTVPNETPPGVTPALPGGPTISNITNGMVFQPDTDILFKSTIFTSVVSDSHASSTWLASTDPQFNNIVDSVVNSVTDLTQWMFTYRAEPGTNLYVKVAYKGSLYGESPYSEAVTFKVGTALINQVILFESLFRKTSIKGLLNRVDDYLVYGDFPDTGRGFVCLLNSDYRLIANSGIELPFAPQGLTEISVNKYLIMGSTLDASGPNNANGKITYITVSSNNTIDVSGPSYSIPKAVSIISATVTYDGGVVIAASLHVAVGLPFENLILILTPDGTLAVSGKLTGSFYSHVRFVHAKDGYIYTAGSVVIGATGSFDAWFLKWKISTGEVVHSKYVQTDGANDECYAGAFTGDGIVFSGVMATGSSVDANGQEIGLRAFGFLVKMDLNLNITLTNILDVNNQYKNTAGYGVTAVNNGYLYVGSLLEHETVITEDRIAAVMKYDSNLNLTKSITLGSLPGWTLGVHVHEDIGGNVVVVGETTLAGVGSNTTGFIFTAPNDLQLSDTAVVGRSEFEVKNHTQATTVLYDITMLDTPPVQWVAETGLVLPTVISTNSLEVSGLTEETIRTFSY